MQNNCQRTHKIDLTISRRARSALSQSINNEINTNNQNKQKQRAPTHKKIIQITISNCRKQKQQDKNNKNNLYMLYQANLAVSQLVFSQKDSERFALQPKTMLNSVRQIQNQDQEKWWEYLNSSQLSSKRELIEELIKNQKKIHYFNDLLKHNTLKFKVQRSERVSKYESYLNKIKQFYFQELKQTNKLNQLVKRLDQEKNEEIYHLLRMKINKDGEKGLNFTPKRLSVFSGMSDPLLFSNRSNETQERQIRNESSFDCTLKTKTNDQSQFRSIIESEKQDEMVLYPNKLSAQVIH